MSVNSISSGSAVAPMQNIQPEAVEPRRVGPDHDGDADDRVGAAGAPPKPVVNTSGETTGLVVNTKA